MMCVLFGDVTMVTHAGNVEDYENKRFGNSWVVTEV